MQIAEDNHARVYANVLHTRFKFHLALIYIKEEVSSKSGKVDRSILQLSYRAFGLNAALMAASTDLVS
jgi:hypothetical protein